MSNVVRLECKDVSFFYDRQILFDVSFRAFAGEILGIVGPNGSGKTTLLRILYHALKPASGHVLLNGCPLQRLKRYQIARKVAVVAQEPVVNFPITVFEFVLQGRSPHLGGFGFESEHDVGIVIGALRRTTMVELADRRVEAISGGEQRRMLLARAIAQDPEILLLDEPTANLDINYQLELFSMIKDLTYEKSLCTILVTHDLNLVSEFSDRVILFHAGKIFQSGTPREILTQRNLKIVFNVDLLVDENPSSGNPRISHKIKIPLREGQGGRL